LKWCHIRRRERKMDEEEKRKREEKERLRIPHGVFKKTLDSLFVMFFFYDRYPPLLYSLLLSFLSFSDSTSFPFFTTTSSGINYYI
jgi:hypothetical protein